jgi:membrane protein implicated in regulation of membrane protease activity
MGDTMIDEEMPMLKPKAPERAACGAALTVAAGAVACGVCCVLPFALPAVALASAGGIIAWLGGVQLWATVLATTIVAAAWIWIVVRSARTKAKPARINALHDGNCDRCVAPRAVVVPHRAIDRARLKGLTLMLCTIASINP